MTEKMCSCSEPGIPNNLPASPYEYQGSAVCSKCKGILKFPFKKKAVVKTGQEVEDFLNTLNARDSGMSMEKAILITLLDIKNLLGRRK